MNSSQFNSSKNSKQPKKGTVQDLEKCDYVTLELVDSDGKRHTIGNSLFTVMKSNLYIAPFPGSPYLFKISEKDD